MRDSEAVRRLQQMIAETDARIARQEKRVAKLSVEFNREALREQAKALLADMMTARALLADHLAAMGDSSDRRQDGGLKTGS